MKKGEKGRRGGFCLRGGGVFFVLGDGGGGKREEEEKKRGAFSYFDLRSLSSEKGGEKKKG